MEDLKVMQNYPLWRKIQVTQSRILEFANKFDNQIYISFSGGKDSTVLLNIARQVIPDVPAVFIDTGLEYPEIREFALSADNVIRIKPEMSFKKVIEQCGYPLISKEVAGKISIARNCPEGRIAQHFKPNNSYDMKYGTRYSVVKWNDLKNSNIPISRRCCDIMKKLPAKRFERKTGLKPVTAMMACESSLRRNQWLQKGCNSFDSKRPLSNPMSFWTEQDVLEYLLQNNIPYASVYGEIIRDKAGKLKTTGEKRTGW